MTDVLRVANCSGFYGDRFEAPAELLAGGPIDVLTGDYLAELTMLILWRTRAKHPDAGYARTFLGQMRESMGIALDQGVKVVVNAGGLNPSGLADGLREIAAELNLSPTIAHVEGDDLLPRLDELLEKGIDLANIDTGAPLSSLHAPPLTANAYLGGWGIAAALDRGADIVVTGRVTDAALVTGPAAWHFGWARDDWDKLAGALVAGHVIECSTQATGGNYSFFTEVPGLEHPGFPIAEIAEDGSSVITKQAGTGGLVSRGTVTAQLLYEVQGTRYLNPDVTALFDSIQLDDDGPDRVRIHGVRGEAPPDTAKVCINTLGGFRNEMTFVLTGLDIEAKAELVERTVATVIDVDAIDDLEFQLIRHDKPDATVNAEATAQLRIVAVDASNEAVGRKQFAAPLVSTALATYPGMTMTAPPGDAQPFGLYWPALVPKSELREVVVIDGERIDVEQVLAGGDTDPGPQAPAAESAEVNGPTVTVPLGTLVGARSGDKGGNANVGFWARTDAAHEWLRSMDVAAFRRLLPEADGLAIQRWELPNLKALNFVVEALLDEGVASARRPDPQAKGLGEFLRSRMVEVPADLVS